MKLAILSAIFDEHPSLGALDISCACSFVNLAQLLKKEISFCQSHSRVIPPSRLPINIHEFLQCSTGLSDEMTKVMWDAFKELIWADHNETSEGDKAKYLPLFIQFGMPRYVCMYVILSLQESQLIAGLLL